MTTLMTTLLDDYRRHPTAPDVLDRWARHDPALAGGVHELARRITSWNHVHSDTVVIPLQHLAVTGDREAARLLVYALCPRLAARTRRHCIANRDEIVAELIGYLYEATVTAHPGWSSRYADQLVRHAHRTNEANRARQQPNADVELLERDIADPHDPFDAVDHATDVNAFLARQTREGHIAPATAIALHRHANGCHAPQPHGTRTADTIRKRRQRDIIRLRALHDEISLELLAS